MRMHRRKILGALAWRTVIHRQKGQGLTEYLILLLLIAIISIAAAKSLGTTIKKKLQMARSHINKHVVLDR